MSAVEIGGQHNERLEKHRFELIEFESNQGSMNGQQNNHARKSKRVLQLQFGVKNYQGFAHHGITIEEISREKESSISVMLKLNSTHFYFLD